MTQNKKKDILIQQIVDISNNLVEGKIENIDLSIIESEIDVLASNFQKLIENFQTLGHNLYQSTNEMPVLTQHLENISETTTQGVIKVMDNAEAIMNSSAELNEKVQKVKDKYSDLSDNLISDLDDIDSTAMQIQNQSFSILTALEFEDINKQQMEKILTALNDFQNEFYKLLVLLKIKDFIEKKESSQGSKVLEDLKQVVDLENQANDKQDLIDQLFQEFGL